MTEAEATEAEVAMVVVNATAVPFASFYEDQTRKQHIRFQRDFPGG